MVPHLSPTVTVGCPVFQVVPPVPKRGLPLSITLSESLPSASEPSEAQTDPNRSQKLRGITHPVLISGRDSSADTDTRKLGDLCPVGMRSTKHTQLENRRSPLGMNSNMEEEKEEEEEEEEFSSHSFISSAYSPSSLKKVTCHTYSLHDPGWSSSRSEHLADGAEMLRSNPLYQASEGAGGSLTQQGGGTYPEVPQKPTSAKLPDDTYEQIPGEPVQGNTYESLEEMKTKKSKSTWGRNVSQSVNTFQGRSLSFNCVPFLFAEYEMDEVPSGLHEEVNRPGAALLFTFSEQVSHVESMEI